MRSMSCSSCNSLVSTANHLREKCEDQAEVPATSPHLIRREAPLQTTYTHKARIQEERGQITRTYHRSCESAVLYQGVER